MKTNQNLLHRSCVTNAEYSTKRCDGGGSCGRFKSLDQEWLSALSRLFLVFLILFSRNVVCAHDEGLPGEPHYVILKGFASHQPGTHDPDLEVGPGKGLHDPAQFSAALELDPLLQLLEGWVTPAERDSLRLRIRGATRYMGDSRLGPPWTQRSLPATIKLHSR